MVMVGLRRHTIGVELQDMQITVCVCDDDEQLFTIGQKVGGDGLDVLRRLAEEAELVRVLLFMQPVISPRCPPNHVFNAISKQTESHTI